MKPPEAAPPRLSTVKEPEIVSPYAAVGPDVSRNEAPVKSACKGAVGVRLRFSVYRPVVAPPVPLFAFVGS